jgi:hypothetical protein
MTRTEGMASRSNRWRSVVGFTPTLLFYLSRADCSPLDRKLEEIKLFCACLKSNPRSCLQIHSPVATTTEICKNIHAPEKERQEVKLSLQQAVEAPRLVRRRGSHIGSEMAMWLSDFRAGLSLTLIGLKGNFRKFLSG